MPTVLIGIVCISFEASSDRLNAEKQDNDKFRIIMSRLEELMPEYVTFEVGPVSCFYLFYMTLRRALIPSQHVDVCVVSSVLLIHATTASCSNPTYLCCMPYSLTA